MRMAIELESRISVRTILATPYERILSAPWYAKTAGTAAGAVSVFFGDHFGKLLIAYALCVAGNYLAGSALAKKERRCNPELAREKLTGKIHTVIQLLVLRFVEGSLAGYMLTTHGAISVSFAAVFFLVEFESWVDNRDALTGKRTPYIRPFLDLVRGAAVGQMPHPKLEHK